jgi:hypothetical protein
MALTIPQAVSPYWYISGETQQPRLLSEWRRRLSYRFALNQRELTAADRLRQRRPSVNNAASSESNSGQFCTWRAKARAKGLLALSASLSISWPSAEQVTGSSPVAPIEDTAYKTLSFLFPSQQPITVLP